MHSTHRKVELIYLIFGAMTHPVSFLQFQVGRVFETPWILFISFVTIRTVSGSRAVLLNVSSTAILMPSKSYSNATVFVSLYSTALMFVSRN